MDKNIYFLNVKFGDKTFVVPIFYVFRIGEVFKTKNKSYYISLDNTCKMLEAFYNTFGFISDDEHSGIKKKNLDVYEKKRLEYAKELHDYLIKNEIMTEQEYKSLNGRGSNANFRILNRHSGKFFSQLGENLDIKPLNFVGKNDEDTDGTIRTVNGKSDLEGFLGLLAQWYGEKEFNFLSHKRFLHGSKEAYLRVLFPEVREEGDEETQGYFNSNGIYITKNLLRLFLKDKVKIIEANDEEKNFRVDTTAMGKEQNDKIDSFKGWNQHKIEEIVLNINPLPKDFNEFYVKIKTEVEKLSSFDLDGIKVTPNEIENELRAAYLKIEPYNYENYNACLWTDLYSAIGELFMRKYFGVENNIYGYNSDSDENRFDLIHYFQCIAYYFIFDICEKIEGYKDHGKLKNGLEKMKPKLKKLDNIIHMLYDKELSGKFNDFLKRLSVYKGTAFDFLIKEVYDDDILEEDINKIKTSADYLASNLNDSWWAGVANVNLFTTDRTKKMKLKDGILLPNGLAFPITRLFDIKSPDSGWKEPFVERQNNKLVSILEKLGEIEILPSQMSLNIDMDQIYINSNDQEKNYIDQLFFDIEKLKNDKEESKTNDGNTQVNNNTSNNKPNSHDENNEKIDHKDGQEESDSYVEELVKDVENDYKNSKVDEEKINKLRDILKKRVRSLDIDDKSKRKLENDIDNTKPNFFGVIWQFIKQLFVPSKKIDLSKLRKLREADNLLCLKEKMYKNQTELKR